MSVYYPVLGTGAVAQYPMRRGRSVTKVETETPGGAVSVAAAGDGQVVSWRLDYEELTDMEAGALRALFAGSQGRLKAFVFLDPMGNLVVGSEVMDGTRWTREPLVTVGPEGTVAETGGLAFRVTNGSAVVAGIGQALTVPAGGCVFSVWLRGDGSTEVTLSLGAAEKVVKPDALWRRYEVRSEGGASEVAVRVGAYGSVACGGPQAEAQRVASAYKATYGDGARYEETRFAEDVLTVESTGPNRNRARVKLESRVRR